MGSSATIGYMNDVFGNLPHTTQFMFSTNMVVQFSTIGCYVIIGLVIAYRSKRDEKGVDAATRRVYRSLTVIIGVVLVGYFASMGATVFLPHLLPDITTFGSYVVITFDGYPTDVSSGLNGPVLYVFR
jgi:hypothetical protein